MATAFLLLLTVLAVAEAAAPPPSSGGCTSPNFLCSELPALPPFNGAETITDDRVRSSGGGGSSRGGGSVSSGGGSSHGGGSSGGGGGSKGGRSASGKAIPRTGGAVVGAAAGVGAGAGAASIYRGNGRINGSSSSMAGGYKNLLLSPMLAISVTSALLSTL